MAGAPILSLLYFVASPAWNARFDKSCSPVDHASFAKPLRRRSAAESIASQPRRLADIPMACRGMSDSGFLLPMGER